MTFEQNMKDMIRNGDRRFFKQSNLKAQKEYENPYSIQGIKAVLLWNLKNLTKKEKVLDSNKRVWYSLGT